MEYSERYENDIPVLQPSGRLDASSSSEFKQKVLSLAAGPAKKVVLDLSKLTFIDSSGLGSMVSLLRTLSKKGGDIRLAALASQVQSLFELTRLHRVFEIYSSVEDALQDF